MAKNLLMGALFCVFSLLSIQVVHADDHEPPFIGGNYWEVTGIKIADGAGLKYSKWLATEWRKSSDFAVKQGWLISYSIISNVHARHDEPDLYIVRVFENMASVAENEKRREEYLAWAKKAWKKCKRKAEIVRNIAPS
ncbi:hypothetical protein [Pseudoalteromonas sp. GB56]